VIAFLRAWFVRPGETMSAFGTYLLGFIVLIVGLAMAAYWLNVSPTWIMIGVVIMIGLGIVMATQRTKMKDPPGSA
jgi:predicted signal transduction protein with EAL and GGDEF domain